MCHASEPPWLTEQYPKPWRHIERALILGKVTGNAVHFLWDMHLFTSGQATFIIIQQSCTTCGSMH